MAIRLRSTQDFGATLVPNEFIDSYMPSANGEFVKVYLYLLRCLSAGRGDVSVCTLADLFDNTEKDICRALRYWEKQGLLAIGRSDDGAVADICLCSPARPHAQTAKPAPAEALSAAESEQPARKEAPGPQQAAVSDASAQTGPAAASHTLSRERLNELMQREDIQQLLFIAEQYLGKTLGSTRISTLLYLYDQLHFPVELIEYLVEYCVSRGSRSVRYIETVALAWHEEGIRTVEQAQEMTAQYNKYVFSVLKSFGIKGRNPVASELAYIKKWTSDFGFPIEIISSACERTITQIHQPSFEYADKILSSWKQQGVRHPADIQKLDTSYQRSRKTEPKGPDPRNKFNNFEQRTYDFKDLERRMLNIQ